MSGFATALIAHSDTATLVALILFVPLFLLFTLRAHLGLRVPLRRIHAFNRLPELSERSTETGAPIVTWLAGGMQETAGPETVAGVTLYDYVSRQSARADQSAPVQVSNPVALLLAMNALQGSRERHQLHASYRGREARFYGPGPLAYASGVSADPETHARTATLLAGPFEAEGLWMGDALTDRDGLAMTVPGDPSGAALVHLFGDERARVAGRDPVLPGEDLYAAGAYLHRTATLGSLLAEDWGRWLIIAAILTLVALTSLGYGG